MTSLQTKNICVNYCYQPPNLEYYQLNFYTLYQYSLLAFLIIIALRTVEKCSWDFEQLVSTFFLSATSQVSSYHVYENFC